jgi:hypothetical protein
MTWQFEAEATEMTDEAAKLLDKSCVDYAAWLFGADKRAMAGGMVSYRVKTARDDLAQRMTVSVAEKNRDAVVAALYAARFDSTPISPHLPSSPLISPHLPSSPRISPHLLSSPLISGTRPSSIGLSTASTRSDAQRALAPRARSSSVRSTSLA